MCTKAAVISEGRLLAFEDMDKILENNPSLEDYFLLTVRSGGMGGNYGENIGKL